MVFSKKMALKSPQIFITFSDRYYVLMLCRKFELIPTNIFRVMSILKTSQFLGKSMDYSNFKNSNPIMIGMSYTKNVYMHQKKQY